MEYVKTINFKSLNLCRGLNLKFIRLQNILRFLLESSVIFTLFYSICLKIDELSVHQMNEIAVVFFIVFLFFILKFFLIYYIMTVTKVIKLSKINVIFVLLACFYELSVFAYGFYILFSTFSIIGVMILIRILNGYIKIGLIPLIFVCYIVRKLKLFAKNRIWKFWACKAVKIFTFFLGLIGPFSFMYISFWFYGIDFENKYYLCLFFVPYFGILKQVIAAIYLKNLRLISSNKKSIDAFIFSNSLKNDIKLYFIFYVLFILFSNLKG